MDFILNGQGSGSVASILLSNNMDPRLLRPYFIGDDFRQPYVTQNRMVNNAMTAVSVPINNTNTVLRDRDWMAIDKKVQDVALPAARLIRDYRSAGLTYDYGFGMGKSILMTERQTDIGRAQLSMSPTVRTPNERRELDKVFLPLPLSHKEFFYDIREIREFQSGQSRLDLSHAADAARVVVEECERLFLGTLPAYRFAGAYAYGLTNFPQRLTATLTCPLDTEGDPTVGWTGKVLVSEIMGMCAQSRNNYWRGPWKLYYSPAWDEVLDADYSDTKGENTLRERILKIKGLQSMEALEFFGNDTWKMVLVMQDERVARLVMGMDVTTIQYEVMGGMEVHFKVMAIMVPQLRCDIEGKTGVVDGSATPQEPD